MFIPYLATTLHPLYQMTWDWTDTGEVASQDLKRVIEQVQALQFIDPALPFTLTVSVEVVGLGRGL